jgi:ATP-dependent 26S proteasome regulatory subunit
MPGTGKTMLIRQLIRHVYRKHRVETSYLAIHRRTDADDLRMLFNSASEKNPALLVLEDIESLCHETQLTRSEVLAELDGLNQRSGMLIIATANDPSRIDPALVHRPSRFDRVWNFPLPDKALRARYVADQFPKIESQLAELVAQETEDWTLAYVKELRNTAGILAIKDGLTAMTPRHVKAALALLREQYQAGKTNYAEIHKSSRKVGFGFHDESREDADKMAASALLDGN